MKPLAHFFLNISLHQSHTKKKQSEYMRDVSYHNVRHLTLRHLYSFKHGQNLQENTDSLVPNIVPTAAAHIAHIEIKTESHTFCSQTSCPEMRRGANLIGDHAKSSLRLLGLRIRYACNVNAITQ